MIATASIQPRVSSVKSLQSIGQISKALGISQQTIRAASDRGELKAFTLPSGHRRFDLNDCYQWLGQGQEAQASQQQETLIYARVSGAKQAKGIARGEASDLSRQIERLLDYVKESYGCVDPKVYRDTGSGVSFSETARPSFCRLIREVLEGQHDGATLVVSFFDRLARFGIELVKLILEAHKIKLVVAFADGEQEEDESLAEVLLAFTHSFSSKLYSRRSAEKLRVAPTADVVKRILELSQQGCASRVIVERLQSEGISTDSKGRVISKSVVQRILKENGSIAEQLVGKPQGNSFGRFCAEHVKLLGDKDGPPIQHKTLMNHYKQWCGGAGETPVSNRRVGKHLAEQGVRSRDHWSGIKQYLGVSIVGLDGSGIWNKSNGVKGA